MPLSLLVDQDGFQLIVNKRTQRALRRNHGEAKTRISLKKAPLKDENLIHEALPSLRSAQEIIDQVDRLKRELEEDAKMMEYLRTSEIGVHVPGSRIQGSHLVCYGLGTFCRSKIARTQLALALLLRDHLFLGSECQHPNHQHSNHQYSHLYDPVMTALDRQVAQHYQFNVDVPANSHNHYYSGYSPDVKVIFFMPHCPRMLYEDVVAANQAYCHHLHVFGNHLASYLDVSGSGSGSADMPVLERLLQEGRISAHSLALDRQHQQFTAFNTLAWHSFPLLDQHQ